MTSGWYNNGSLVSGFQNLGNAISGIANTSDVAGAALMSGIGNIGNHLSGILQGQTQLFSQWAQNISPFHFNTEVG